MKGITEGKEKHMMVARLYWIMPPAILHNACCVVMIIVQLLDEGEVDYHFYSAHISNIWRGLRQSQI